MRAPLLIASLVLAVFAGCIESPDEPDGATGDIGPWLELQVTDAETGEPVPYAQAVGLAAGMPMGLSGSGPNGTITMRIDPTIDQVVVEGDGYTPRTYTNLRQGAHTVPLSPLAESDLNATGLSFRSPLDLGSQTYPLAIGTACLDDVPNDDCGLGEPTIEVDAEGTIYLSGVCCIGAAPPVFVSRDDGESFQHLETPGLREAFGIEGDFAIDDDGVVYFVDIELAATFQVTAWDKDGNYLHHMKWPAPPLVDRPWVRAEGSGVVYYVYNTGSETNVYTSQDQGRTWSPIARVSLPYALGNPIKGLEPGELWVVGGSDDGNRRVDYTTDGGETWHTERSSSPAGGSFPVGYFDEAGNLYLVANAEGTITVARRDTEGTWHEPVDVTPGWGTHRFPWIAAGKEGSVAVAWYGTPDDEPTDASEWFLFVAASLDAQQDEPNWAVAKADPVPVLVGDLQRQLLDFLQLDIGPDDAIHVGYSKVPSSGGHEQLHYIRSDRSLPLSPETFFWGPR